MSSLIKRLELLEKKSPNKAIIKAHLYATDDRPDTAFIRDYQDLRPDADTDYFIVHRLKGDGMQSNVYDRDLKLVELLPEDQNMPKLSEDELAKAENYVVDKLGG